MKTILVTIPKGFTNTAVTSDDFFIADTGILSNWDTLRFPLPKGKWYIMSSHKQDVLLVKYSLCERILHKFLNN